jgi:hypothetical protein
MVAKLRGATQQPPHSASASCVGAAPGLGGTESLSNLLHGLLMVLQA